jgi:hypothetical protein
MKRTFAISIGLLLLCSTSLNAAEDRKERVLNDPKEVEAAGHWIYNDFAQGVAEATRARKPMLVIFRCVP